MDRNILGGATIEDVLYPNKSTLYNVNDSYNPDLLQSIYNSLTPSDGPSPQIGAGAPQLTTDELIAQQFGLSVTQMNANPEDVLDSILSSTGGFTNESARIAAEALLNGKLNQVGVFDPVARQAALNAGMQSLAGGGSGLDAVNAAVAGTKDFVADLLVKAKDLLDAGYDATIGRLPEILTPESVVVGPGTVGGTWEIGEGSSSSGSSAPPVVGGTVGTVGGGTTVGVSTTGNAILDAILAAVKGGVDARDIEEIIRVILTTQTGIPTEIVKAGIEGAKNTIEGTKVTVDLNTCPVGTKLAGQSKPADGICDPLTISGAGTTQGPETACPNSTQKRNADGVCVCPDGTTFNVATQECETIISETACPDSTQTKNANGECVCPTGTIFNATTQTCETIGTACPDSTQTKNANGECVCPTGTTFNVATQKCKTIETACPDSTQTKNADGVCVCPTGTIFNAATQTCETIGSDCPDPTQTKNANDECVCPTGTIFNAATQTCETIVSDACPPGTKLAGKPIPADKNCNPGDPESDRCPPGTKLAGKPIPADKNCNPGDPESDLCPPGTKLAGKPKPVNGNCNPGNPPPPPPPPPPDVCPPGTKLAGKPIPAGGNCNPGFPESDVCPSGTILVGQPIPADGNCNPGGDDDIDFTSFFGIRTKPGEKVGAIDPYDIGGSSIFRTNAKTLEQEDPLAYLYAGYGAGGIVQDYDFEELIQYLTNPRG